jgi:uncharacterized protein (DUF427 family)
MTTDRTNHPHPVANPAPPGPDAPQDRPARRVPAGVSPVVPGPGQESVWDYPRPPRIEPVPERVRVIVDGVTIVDSRRALRVLETSHPPVYYVPRADVTPGSIVPASGASFCEWKGAASYWAIEVGGRRIDQAAWSYEHPTAAFEPLRGHLAFYALLVDEAWVGDERATAQPGGFYGGWVTSRIVGPIKGEAGSRGW